MTPVFAIEFYSQVLVELVGAFGLALLVANVFAIFRPRRPVDGDPAATKSKDSIVDHDIVNDASVADDATTLTRAPILRSVVFALMGAVMFVWALASYFR